MKKTVLTIFIIGLFQFTLLSQTRTVINISAKETTVVSYTDKEVNLTGKSDLHLTSLTCKSALVNSIINLTSENSWLFFDNIRPDLANDSLLKNVYVNGSQAANKTNVRIAVYKQGSVIMAHPNGFKPLTAFSSTNFTGDSAMYILNNMYNGLGTMDNKIRSFKLKRGYMATLGNNSDGTGYSRIFIADKQDIEIAEMNYLLDQTVSFIRVFPWEFVSKKGWAGSNYNEYNKVKATWRYDWSAGGSTTNLIEYVPIKQNGGWPGWSEINTKNNITHLLGFNEPDRPDQSNLTVAQALAAWPEFMKSGLRVGTPATSSPNAWLYEFVDSCKARNYRLDFLAVHCYWGGKSAQNWYNDLKYVHTRTGLPIWITEWNNGANWTTETWPTTDMSLSTANAAKQLNDIKGILQVLDTASFIERYSIYNWVQDCRAMVLADTLTPAGKYYAADKPGFAFNKNKEVIPTYKLNKNPTLTISYGTSSVALNVKDANGDYFRGFLLEKKIADGVFAEVINSDSWTVKSGSDTLDLSKGAVKYRAKVKLADGSISNYTPETGMDITSGGSIAQFGKIDVTNVDWNSVFFKKAYDDIPSVVLGAPSNNNTTALISPRVKFVSKTSRFQVQASPWSYQGITALGKDESIPYLTLLPGTYDFGGVKALAARATANGNWTTITFSTPFETVPVVFANQLIAGTTYATSLRIKDVTTTGFKIRITKEAAITSTPGTETISYIAITPGTGKMDGYEFKVGNTASNFIGTTAKLISYGDTIPDPVFVSQMQTCNDDTTATLRTYLVYDKGAYVFKQREKSLSSLSTAFEGVGWIVINPVNVIQGVNTPQENTFSVYPNPVKDLLYFSESLPGTQISVYNLSGVLLKTFRDFGNQISVEDLQPGCYLLKAGQNKITRFIKL
jgi:hypothetical protein